MKTCVRCRRDRDLDHFYRRAGAKDGRASYCKDCQRVYIAGWKKQNPEKVSANNKRDYQRHRDAKLAQGARWRQANKTRHRAMIAAWEARNPEKLTAKYQRYRAKHPERFKRWQDQRRESGRRRLSNLTRRGLVARASLPGAPVTLSILNGRFAIHGHRCYYCGARPRRLVAEHRTPLSRGGLHCGANIVPACPGCNFRKGSKTEREFTAM